MGDCATGALLHVLKYSRTAWYRGADGTTAYYEHPTLDAPGSIRVNGQLIADLIVDRAGHYSVVPSPQVQHKLIEKGVRLDSGWTCNVEIFGEPINEAFQKSPYRAVRHHNGQITAQYLNETIAIFVGGMLYWRIHAADAHRVFAELGASITDGWYPVHQDLIQLSQSLANWPDHGTTRAPVAAAPEVQSPIVLRAGEPITSYHGSTVVVPIEGMHHGFPRDLSITLLAKIVPHIPLEGYQCRVTRQENRDLLQIILDSTSADLGPATSIFWFGRADTHRIPDGVSAQTLIEFVQYCARYGLNGCAMQIRVDRLGFARELVLLKPGWRSRA